MIVEMVTLSADKGGSGFGDTHARQKTHSCLFTS